MKKAIPALIAIVLIIIIAGAALGQKAIEKYSYTDERADLYEYFGMTDDREVPITYRGEKLGTKAIYANQTYYMDLDSIHSLLNKRFYWDQNEEWLIFTTPTERIMSQVGSSSYSVLGESKDMGFPISYVEGEGEEAKLFVSLEFVHMYTNFTYNTYQAPNRIMLFTEDVDYDAVEVTKDSAVRLKGGVKSPILENVAKGDSLILLEYMEDWSKVETEDGLIGMIENKHVTEPVQKTRVFQPNYDEPEYTTLTSDELVSVGWHVIAGTAGNDTIYSATENTKGMDVISPTWFRITDNDGNMSSFATQRYVDIAHNMGLQVWGLVDDFSCEFSDYEVFSYTSKRDRVVAFLINEALTYGLEGINVDFEDVSSQAGPHYVQFLRELSIACRNNGLVFSIDNYVQYNFNEYYDVEEQGAIADYVILMGYDEHYHGCGNPGSVASIGYIKYGITQLLEKNVPANKIINGLPLYTILWRTQGTTVTDDYVIMSNQEELKAKLGLNPAWDEETCQNYAETTSGGIFYQIWFEDAESINVKLNVMRANNIGGVAVWRLGYEDPSIWNIISSYSD